MLTCAARYGKHAPTDAGRIAIRALEAATADPGAPGGATAPQAIPHAPAAISANA